MISAVLSNEKQWHVEQADCLDFMRSLPDRCVDLVMCSPPYEKARTYGIDFNLSGQAWVDWAVERFLECVRVCKGLVVWVIEGQTRKFRWSATPALFMADLHRAGVHLRKPPIFSRCGIPGSGGPDWWRNDYEFCVCGSSGGKLPWSDNTAMGHTPKWAPGGEMSYRQPNGARLNQWGHSIESGATVVDAGGVVRSKGRRPSHKNADKPGRRIATRPRDGMHGGQENTIYKEPVLANPGNVAIEHRYEFTATELSNLVASIAGGQSGDVLKCIVGGGVMGSGLTHENEAPYPEKLVEWYVRSFCPPDGITVDGFSGSGTTAKVALKTGRRFIGCDVRESQVELTKRRIAEVQKELFV